MDKPPVTGRYIDPLVAFLNEVFRGRKYIADLTYNKNEHPGDLKDEGAAIFDLLCTGADGDKFIIEIQRGRQGNFKERALFYTSRLISDQAPKGKRSSWAYNLTGVYLIALLEDFTLGINTSPEYLHDIYLCNRDTGEIFYEKLGYTYIELIKFAKTDNELESDLDKWLYVLKNLSRMNKLPVYLRKPVFEKLFSIAEYINLTKEEKTMYDSSQKRRWDNQNVLEYTMKESMEKGMEKGIQIGIEKGIAQGIEKGIEKGKLEEAKEIAREMKKDGLPLSQISKFTKLSIEEIEQL
jgi:predicted transposase/invertase (TIGR01784 family)